MRITAHAHIGKRPASNPHGREYTGGWRARMASCPEPLKKGAAWIGWHDAHRRLKASAMYAGKEKVA